MTLDPLFFAMAVPAVLFAGISKAGFGSGAAFAAAPFLALILEPEAAVGLMLPLLMLIDATSLKPYWGKWHWPSARLLILGGLPGVALGALFWQWANADVLRLLIGTIALGFVAYQLFGTRLLVRGHAGPAAGIVAGVASGFTSFVSHAGGPAAAVYLLSQNLTKTQYQSTTVLVFWVVNIAKAIPFTFLGIFTAETLMAGLYLIPAALLGTWIGVVAHRAIPERVFFAVTYIFLSVTGVKLIWDALT
jgi:uncharacterized membrane protein YfcA